MHVAATYEFASNSRVCYRPGQANCKFQFSMQLVKKPQFWCNLAQTFSDWLHHGWEGQLLKVWAKLDKYCGFFINSIEIWNLQLACPGLYCVHIFDLVTQVVKTFSLLCLRTFNNGQLPKSVLL